MNFVGYNDESLNFVLAIKVALEGFFRGRTLLVPAIFLILILLPVKMLDFAKKSSYFLVLINFHNTAEVITSFQKEVSID